MEFLFYHLRIIYTRVLENFITSTAAPGNPIKIISRRQAPKFGVFLSSQHMDKEQIRFSWGAKLISKIAFWREDTYWIHQCCWFSFVSMITTGCAEPSAKNTLFEGGIVANNWSTEHIASVYCYFLFTPDSLVVGSFGFITSHAIRVLCALCAHAWCATSDRQIPCKASHDSAHQFHTDGGGHFHLKSHEAYRRENCN